jgi:hypothetical protein
MTPTQSSRIVAVLMLAFPGEVFPGELWDRMLADLDYALVNAAVDRHIATSRFPPTIAAIREAALAVAAGEVRTGLEAWADVLVAMGQFGRYRSPGTDFEFYDDVINVCVTPTIWREFCDGENQTADRARFVDMYEKAAATHRRKQLTSSLPAIRQLAASPQRRKLSAANIEERTAERAVERRKAAQ